MLRPDRIAWRENVAAWEVELADVEGDALRSLGAVHPGVLAAAREQFAQTVADYVAGSGVPFTGMEID